MTHVRHYSGFRKSKNAVGSERRHFSLPSGPSGCMCSLWSLSISLRVRRHHFSLSMQRFHSCVPCPLDVVSLPLWWLPFFVSSQLPSFHLAHHSVNSLMSAWQRVLPCPLTVTIASCYLHSFPFFYAFHLTILYVVAFSNTWPKLWTGGSWNMITYYQPLSHSCQLIVLPSQEVLTEHRMIPDYCQDYCPEIHLTQFLANLTESCSGRDGDNPDRYDGVARKNIEMG